MKYPHVVLIASLLVQTAAAGSGTTSPNAASLRDRGWISERHEHILLIRTTDVVLSRIFRDLGLPHDDYEGSNWTRLELSEYDQVFVAMDGGIVKAESVANLHRYVSAGGCLHIVGGTYWQEYALALNTYLLENDVYDYGWSHINGVPHSTTVDPGHYLAVGLPRTYNFTEVSATYYETRPNDFMAEIAAVNGDRHAQLLSKTIGAGNFDLLINSPYIDYWTDSSDYN